MLYILSDILNPLYIINNIYFTYTYSINNNLNQTCKLEYPVSFIFNSSLNSVKYFNNKCIHIGTIY